jgi:hypothetical protein
VLTHLGDSGVLDTACVETVCARGENRVIGSPCEFKAILALCKSETDHMLTVMTSGTVEHDKFFCVFVIDGAGIGCHGAFPGIAGIRFQYGVSLISGKFHLITFK